MQERRKFIRLLRELLGFFEEALDLWLAGVKADGSSGGDHIKIMNIPFITN